MHNKYWMTDQKARVKAYQDREKRKHDAITLGLTVALIGVLLLMR